MVAWRGVSRYWGQLAWNSISLEVWFCTGGVEFCSGIFDCSPIFRHRLIQGIRGIPRRVVL